MKNITKIRLCVLLTTGLILAASAAPLDAKEPERRHERAERAKPTETPYSNRSVRRDREALRQAKEAERAKRPDYYRFGREDSGKTP